MLHIHDLTKQYGSKVLFKGAEAHLGYRSRVALVGPNGAGKSTLTKILLGQEAPDEGRVTHGTNLSIGHLPQELPKFSGKNVLAEVMRMDGRREGLIQERAEIEKRFAESPESADQASLERYGRLLEELDHLDEYRLEARAKAILSGMGFKSTDFERSLTEFSGGWLMRVALARILLMDPDLLLLDEPTNHLDLESLLWLEEFLQKFQGAMLLISHDTAFLNRIVTEVMEIDQQRLWVYRGNLDSYVEQKQERIAVLRSQQANQDAKIADLEDFIRRFGAKATKARQAQSRMKQLEKIEAERVDLPEERATVGFRFPAAPHSGKEVITAKAVSVTFPGKKVLKNLEWVIRRGTRTAIVGVNGAGKTTLLRLLGGDLKPTQGELKLGHEVKVGYYAQIQAESLNMQQTILKELEAVAPSMPVARVRAIAGAFLFTGDDVQKRCGVLSGGEKARVALAKLLLSPSNFLILDEPTNHLDVESRGVLLEALQDYEGTLCLVSHDRAFVSPLVDQVLEIVPGPDGSEVLHLVGSYDDYLERKIREAAGAAQLSGTSTKDTPAANPSTASDRDAPAKKKDGPSNNQVRAWDRERETAEKEIAKLEAKQAALQTEMSDPATYDDKPRTLKLLQDQRELEAALSKKLARWEELCGLLEQK